MLLTGTPLQNDMEELFALLSYLQPDLFTHHEMFSVKFYTHSKFYFLNTLQKQLLSQFCFEIELKRLCYPVDFITGPIFGRFQPGKGRLKFSFAPKNKRKYFCKSALASKKRSNQKNKGTLGHARAEIQKYFNSFFGAHDNFKQSFQN